MTPNAAPPFNPFKPEAGKPVSETAVNISDTPKAGDLVDLLEREGKQSQALGLALVNWVAMDPIAAVITSQSDPALAPVAMRVAQLAMLIQPRAILFNPEVVSAIADQRTRQFMLSQLMAVDAKLVSEVPVEWFGDQDDENARTWQQTIKFAALAREDPYTAWQEAMQLTDNQARFSALHNVASRWAADEPQLVLEEVSRLKLSQPYMTSLIGAALEAWATKDADAAISWLVENEQQAHVGYNIGRLAAQQDLDKAVDTAKSLPANLQQQFINGITTSVAAGTGRMDRLLDALDGHPLYGWALAMMSQKLLQNDPSTAFDLLEAADASTLEETVRGVAPLAWQADEQRTARLLDRLSDDAHKKVIPSITDHIYSQDTERAFRYVENLPTQELRDAGNHRLVNRLLQAGKLDEAELRIDEIEDRSIRLSAVQYLVRLAPTNEQAMEIAEKHELPSDVVESMRVR